MPWTTAEVQLPSSGPAWLRISHSPMNISRNEQRVLHVLALGGRIDPSRNHGNRDGDIVCVTRDRPVRSDCTLPVVQRLRRKRLIASPGGGPCRIRRPGRLSVRARADKQG